MSSWVPPKGEPGQRNARRSGRVRVQTIACDLGEIMDLSAGGAKVLCCGRGGPKHGQFLDVRIAGLESEIRVRARVVRSTPRGRRASELGLEFLDVDPAVRVALTALARSVAHNETMAIRNREAH